jgi:hypothetical protein
VNNEPVKLEKSRSKIDISRRADDYQLEVLPNNYAGFKKVQITASSPHTISSPTLNKSSIYGSQDRLQQVKEERFRRYSGLGSKQPIEMETSKSLFPSRSPSRNLAPLQDIEKGSNSNSISQVLA